MGVLVRAQALQSVNTVIGPALIGKDPVNQKAIDEFMYQELDGSKNEWGWNKQRLGANAILAVSLAVCKAGAAAKGLPLYRHIAELAGEYGALQAGNERCTATMRWYVQAIQPSCFPCRRSTSSTVAPTPATSWPCKSL